MTLFPDIPVSTTPDSDDSALWLIDNVTHRLTTETQRSLILPTGMVDAINFATVAEELLESADTLTGWDKVGGVTLATDTVNKSQGTGSVSGTIRLEVAASSIYYTFPVAVSTVGRPHMAIDLRWDAEGSSVQNRQTYMEIVAADGTALTGTTARIPYPLVADGSFVTVDIPVDTLSSVKSVGVNRVVQWTGAGTNLRTRVRIDNIRWPAQTEIDAALASSTTAAVVVPPAYTPGSPEGFRILGDNQTVLDLRAERTTLSRFNGIHHSRDYNIPEDGVTDCTAMISQIISQMEPGDELHFTPGAQYLTDTTISFAGKRDLKIYGHNATFFGSVMRDSPFFDIDGNAQSIYFEKVRVNGYSHWDQPGNQLVTIAGTPTTLGTTKLLDAQDEAVARATIGHWVGRDKDGLQRWEVTLSDSAQVASDCLLEVQTPDGTVLQTTTLTLTATPTVYAVTYRPSDIETRTRFVIKKATATANTITVTTYRDFRLGAYSTAMETNAGWSFSGARGLTLIDCVVEAAGGDALQNSSSLAYDLTIRNLLSRCCGRQGISFNLIDGAVVDGLRIIGAGRSGVDIEPYDDTWYCANVWLMNVYINGVGTNSVSSLNWDRILNIHWNNVEIVAPAGGGRAPFNMGAVVGSLTRVRTTQEDIGTTSLDGSILGDIVISGQDIHCSDINSHRGIRFSESVKGGLSPGGHTLTGWRVRDAGLYAALTIGENVTVTVNGGPGQSYELNPEFGRSNVHGAVGPINGRLRHASALMFGVHQNRLPRSYKGIAHTSVWEPGGFDLLDEPLHRIAGLSGSQTAVTLLGSATRTITDVSASVDAGAATVARFRLYASAASGTTPTLDVAIQQSHDNTTWTTVDSFRQATAATSEWLEVRNTGRYLRAAYTIAGTSPSFTFSVIGDVSVASNNLRGVNVAVAASAPTHAVTFPARSFPQLASFTLAATTGGALTPSTTYYYRVAARPLHGGPIVPLAQQSVTLSSVQNAINVNLNGVEALADGVHIQGMTIYRGTVSGGPYTARYDVLPRQRFSTMALSNQTVRDLGSTAEIVIRESLSYYQTSGYPATVPVQAGSFTPVDETNLEIDTSYGVTVTPNWPTQLYVTNKARSGFTVNFGSNAPVDGSGRLDWVLVR